MPSYIDNQGQLLEKPKLSDFQSDKSTYHIYYDSEFATKNDYQDVLSLQFKNSQLSNSTIVFDKSELSTSFNPCFEILEYLSCQVSPMFGEDFAYLYQKLQLLYEQATLGVRGATKLRRIVESKIESGFFDEVLNEYGLSRENIEYKRTHSKSTLDLQFHKVTFHFIAHHAESDFGKIWGREWQHIILNAALESRRTIKNGLGTTKSGTSYKKHTRIPTPVQINGVWCECRIEFRDTMHRMPVLSGKGLANQCKVYQADVLKLDVETPENACKLGLNDPSEIKSNMDVLREKLPDLFVKYGALDCHATEALSDKTLELLNQVRAEFGLSETTLEKVSDTAGSNVSTFLEDLIQKHFNNSKEVTTKKNQATVKQVQELEHNQFGMQSLQTVGGLLFSRTARHPKIDGIFGDLDESSCYATALSSMSLYLGSPIIHTFRGKKRPLLREVLPLLQKICNRDAWLVRVSGKFKKAVNTLLLSNLAFKAKLIKVKTIFDKRKSTKSVEEWNAYKVRNGNAQSTLLTKECEFSLINAELLDCINLLPDEWVEEYLDLSVDVMAFIPSELVCESVEELIAKQDKYPQDSVTPIINPESGELNLKIGYASRNVCLRFPIDEYYENLKTIRAEYKKAKNPIQEVFKLILNSTYGALSCEHLPVNNLLAANQITASARATSWLMINALNGFQVITDGCTYSWENVPVGKTFKQILSENPNYLINYNPSIKSNLVETIGRDRLEQDCQQWVDENFIQHMKDFFESDCRPISRYSFELKDASYTLEDGSQLKGVRTFTTFINHGSGGYVKGYQGSLNLYDDVSYDLSEPTFTKVKARSFKGADQGLLNWYVDTFTNGYKAPYIYSEKELLKFGISNDFAIRILESDDSLYEIVHPMGMMLNRFKIMKLVTRSQFLFKNKKQLRNFEKNQDSRLSNLSSWMLHREYWPLVSQENLKQHGAETRPCVDYLKAAKDNPIGLGWEVLATMPKYDGDLTKLRNTIADAIEKGVTNFNASLNLERNLDNAIQYADDFAAVVVLRANALDDLKKICKNSVEGNPTTLVVNRDNIRQLDELLDGE